MGWAHQKTPSRNPAHRSPACSDASKEVLNPSIPALKVKTYNPASTREAISFSIVSAPLRDLTTTLASWNGCGS
jgi:hypothetical protein